MKEEQDRQCGEGCAAAHKEGWAVIANDDGVVGDADYGEDEQDHDGTQPPERRAEPEDVPCHRDPRRSVHGSPAAAGARHGPAASLYSLGGRSRRRASNAAATPAEETEWTRIGDRRWRTKK